MDYINNTILELEGKKKRNCPLSYWIVLKAAADIQQKFSHERKKIEAVCKDTRGRWWAFIAFISLSGTSSFFSLSLSASFWLWMYSVSIRASCLRSSNSAARRPLYSASRRQASSTVFDSLSAACLSADHSESSAINHRVRDSHAELGVNDEGIYPTVNIKPVTTLVLAITQHILQEHFFVNDLYAYSEL